ncbi:MAG: HDOD domain-containing protein [Chromatiales bacterium]|nr:HDOD domain-containing protein [Chromatiales bacterium]
MTLTKRVETYRDWGMDARVAVNLVQTMSDSGPRLVPPMELRDRIRLVKEIPPMPELARRVLELGTKNNPSAQDLAQVVEGDPGLAALVLRWARSPLYGYTGKILHVKDAISRVLGYDTVWNLALGMATLRPWSVPMEGPLGMRAIWRHSIYSAMVMDRLARRAELPLDPGVAYVSGLLHDLGLMLLGELFPEEYRYLSKVVAKNPNLPLMEVERFALGVDHGVIGFWLMDAWDLPKPYQIAATYAMNPDYQGPQQEYAWLALLADRLLAGMEGVFAPTADHTIPTRLVVELGLGAADLAEALGFVMERHETLDELSRGLAA